MEEIIMVYKLANGYLVRCGTEDFFYSTLEDAIKAVPVLARHRDELLSGTVWNLVEEKK